MNRLFPELSKVPSRRILEQKAWVNKLSVLVGQCL
ncbi:MAG: hypothetical protein ACI9XK_004909 [Granulosicoccus sp.]